MQLLGFCVRKCVQLAQKTVCVIQTADVKVKKDVENVPRCR